MKITRGDAVYQCLVSWTRAVAAHEMGHALGLRDFKVRNLLMFESYQEFPENFTLHMGDIKNIQKLYGEKPTQVSSITPRSTMAANSSQTSTSSTTITDTPYGDNGFCNHTYKIINAAMRISGNDFVFVDYTTVIDGRNGLKTDTRNIFPGGPIYVQAAVYSEQTRKAYLFEDDNVWAYSLDSNVQFS